MRLTCPRCGAQYEIPESVIPASGREVECSACSEVWHQPGIAPAPEHRRVAHRADETLPSYDATARPTLNRPLHESVLAILREETARELSARAAQAGPGAAPGQDPATPLPGAALPSGPEIEWPVSTVILPGEPITPEDKAADIPPADPRPEPEDFAAPAIVAQQPPVLPDAARLAATLTRAVPIARANADVIALPLSEAKQQAPGPGAAAPPAIRPAAPVPTPPARRGYAAGFAMALVLAVALVASYRLAPPLTPETAGAALAEWRQQLDQGRLWLHERALALRGIFADG